MSQASIIADATYFGCVNDDLEDVENPNSDPKTVAVLAYSRRSWCGVVPTYLLTSQFEKKLMQIFRLSPTFHWSTQIMVQTDYNDSEIIDIVKSLVHPMKLTIEQCPDITDQTITFLAQVPTLEYLRIKNCPKVTPRGWLEFLRSPHLCEKAREWALVHLRENCQRNKEFREAAIQCGAFATYIEVLDAKTNHGDIWALCLQAAAALLLQDTRNQGGDSSATKLPQEQVAAMLERIDRWCLDCDLTVVNTNAISFLRVVAEREDLIGPLLLDTKLFDRALAKLDATRESAVTMRATVAGLCNSLVTAIAGAIAAGDPGMPAVVPGGGGPRIAVAAAASPAGASRASDGRHLASLVLESHMLKTIATILAPSPSRYRVADEWQLSRPVPGCGELSWLENEKIDDNARYASYDCCAKIRSRLDLDVLYEEENRAIIDSATRDYWYFQSKKKQDTAAKEAAAKNNSTVRPASQEQEYMRERVLSEIIDFLGVLQAAKPPAPLSGPSTPMSSIQHVKERLTSCRTAEQLGVTACLVDSIIENAPFFIGMTNSIGGFMRLFTTQRLLSRIMTQLQLQMQLLSTADLIGGCGKEYFICAAEESNDNNDNSKKKSLLELICEIRADEFIGALQTISSNASMISAETKKLVEKIEEARQLWKNVMTE